MKGKTVIITGATSGIGEQTLIRLAQQGATIGFIGRNLKKCKETRDRARLASGNPAIRYHLADFRSLSQVADVAKEIIAEYPCIDVLINNAGLITQKHEETEDGFELLFGVNHLAHFYLTQLLLPNLRTSDSARIINVASAAFMMAKINFDDLNWGKRRYRSVQAYADSKHANILFTLALAERLKTDDITVNCLHPGVVASNFADGLPIIAKAFAPLMMPFLKSSEKGAATSIYLASSPDVNGVSGQYFVNRKRKPLPSNKSRMADANRLWIQSEEALVLASKDSSFEAPLGASV